MVNLHPRYRLTNFERQRGICMLEGMTQRQVADDLGVNQSVICRAWNQYQRHDNVSNCHGGGGVAKGQLVNMMSVFFAFWQNNTLLPLQLSYVLRS